MVQSYELFYWPSIQGRGEFVRLALEEAGVDYVDVARGPKGVEKLMAALKEDATPAFAPPFLRDGDLVIAQTANILHYLGPRLGLAPQDEEIRRDQERHQRKSPEEFRPQESHRTASRCPAIRAALAVAPAASAARRKPFSMNPS